MDMSQLASAMNGLCLAGRLIGAGAALARCILKARSEDQVWACLDEHAGVAGTSVIGCIIGCIVRPLICRPPSSHGRLSVR